MSMRLSAIAEKAVDEFILTDGRTQKLDASCRCEESRRYILRKLQPVTALPKEGQGLHKHARFVKGRPRAPEAGLVESRPPELGIVHLDVVANGKAHFLEDGVA